MQDQILFLLKNRCKNNFPMCILVAYLINIILCSVDLVACGIALRKLRMSVGDNLDFFLNMHKDQFLNAYKHICLNIFHESSLVAPIQKFVFGRFVNNMKTR